MNQFKPRSQAGQDIFAWIASGRKTDGTFLDIGSGHACVFNNTVSLEQVGWTGDLLDITDLAHDSAEQLRKSKFHRVDTSNCDWGAILGDKNSIDYLSLDVDEASLRTLLHLPNNLRFGVITIEHDSYRFGHDPRKLMRENLMGLGYILIASDVKDQNLEFEDWWVDPKWEQNATPFRSASSDWHDVVSKVAL